MLVTPERRMSSCVMTETAAGDCESFSDFRETVVTSICSKVSMGSSVRSGWAGGVCPNAPRAMKRQMEKNPSRGQALDCLGIIMFPVQSEEQARVMPIYQLPRSEKHQNWPNCPLFRRCSVPVTIVNPAAL